MQVVKMKLKSETRFLKSHLSTLVNEGSKHDVPRSFVISSHTPRPKVSQGTFANLLDLKSLQLKTMGCRRWPKVPHFPNWKHPPGITAVITGRINSMMIIFSRQGDFGTVLQDGLPGRLCWQACLKVNDREARRYTGLGFCKCI